jgi:group I intron endonuclease
MIIYKVTNKINGKSYIGQTTQTLLKRKREHIKSALRRKEGKNYFHWAIVEYGEENFEWTELEKCDNQKELNEREKFYIEKFKSNKSDLGYNGSLGGQGISQRGKLQRLVDNWPKGTLKTVKELKTRGYTPQLLKVYSNSNWIELFTRGMYKRSDDNVTWQGALFAIQQKSNTTLHAGGKTALVLKGDRNYLNEYETYIYLFSSRSETVQMWVRKFKEITVKKTEVFSYTKEESFTKFNAGSFSIKISTPELAAMEMLYLIPNEQSFDEALKIMERLTTLRPQLVQQLLEECNSVKVKRLFLYMAEKNDHQWFQDLNIEKINLGSGKRVIVKNGVFDKKYLITVPREYAK